MAKHGFTRRRFIASVSAGSVAAIASGAIPVLGKIGNNAGKLAILGGTPVVQTKKWPDWPYVDQKMVDAIIKTTKSGIWSRIQSENGAVPTFEKEYAAMMGAKRCVTTGSGTQALSCVVEALGIGAGDEVITSPYTDMGTISSIITSRALPVMADIDPESFQIDPADVERKITPNTKAIMPVDMGGQPCNLAKINAIAKKHKLKVIEDSCQGHLGVYQGKMLGNHGEAGCFSFQTSKTIACGEGGAVIGSNEELMDKVFSVMMNGSHKIIGTKYRMTEFEAALLQSQLAGAHERFEIRNRNAAYLTSKLKKFPGLVPQKLYSGTASGSFYLYMMAYRKEHFNNADRNKFLKAMAAEGIELSSYIARGLHKEPWTEFIMNQDVYKKMFPPERLRKYREELHLPVCDRICEEMAMIWASGPLLGTQSDMDDIINAVMKVYDNRDKLNSI
jgi:dTDP-4-amino-4,6-dideoxygalactose transaminase